MKPSHTPGPWTFTLEPQPNGCPIIGYRGAMVAVLTHSIYESGQEIEALANAMLIAAAPELLAALEEMTAIVRKHSYPQPDKPMSAWARMEAAEAVIARARGDAAVLEAQTKASNVIISYACKDN